MKKFILGFFVASIIFIGIGVVAYNYKSEDVTYTPSDNGWNVNNVKDAVDDIYGKLSKGNSFEFLMISQTYWDVGSNKNSYIIIKKDGTRIYKVNSTEMVSDSDGVVLSAPAYATIPTITVGKSGYYSIGAGEATYYDAGSSFRYGGAYLASLIYYGETNPTE